MRTYEVTYILSPEMEEEQVTELQEKFTNMVTEAGGEIVNIDNWGKRKLAYEIEGKNEGIYVITKFNSQSEAAENLRRNLKISDQVLKALVINLN